MRLEDKCDGMTKKIKKIGQTLTLAGMLLGFSACGGESDVESTRESSREYTAKTEQATPVYVRDTIVGVPLSVSKHPSTQSRYYKHLDEGGIAIGLYTEERGLLLAKDKGFDYSGSNNYNQVRPIPHDHSTLQYVAIEALIEAEMKLDPKVEITLIGKDTRGAFFFDEIILPSYTIKLHDERTKQSYVRRNVE